MADTNPEGSDQVTLTDIAERAGVSKAAASLALRGKPGVGDATRMHMLEVASELRYRSDASISASDQVTIGILVKARPMDVGRTNPFAGPSRPGSPRHAQSPVSM